MLSKPKTRIKNLQKMITRLEHIRSKMNENTKNALTPRSTTLDFSTIKRNTAAFLNNEHTGEDSALSFDGQFSEYALAQKKVTER